MEVEGTVEEEVIAVDQFTQQGAQASNVISQTNVMTRASIQHPTASQKHGYKRMQTAIMEIPVNILPPIDTMGSLTIVKVMQLGRTSSEKIMPTQIGGLTFLMSILTDRFP